jgi:hypothetical protein
VAFWSPLGVPSFSLLFVVQSQLNHHISDNFGWQHATSLDSRSEPPAMIAAWNRVYPILCLFSTFNARPASQKMLLKGREFRLAPR